MMGIGNNILMKSTTIIPIVIESYTTNIDIGYPYEMVLTKPTGVVTGNLLMILICHDSTGIEAYREADTPAGWTWLTSNGDSAADAGYFIMYRISDGTEAATTTVVPTNSFMSVGFYLRISGANTSSPIVGIGTRCSTGSASSLTVTGLIGNSTDLGITVLSGDGGDLYPYSVSTNSWTKVVENQGNTTSSSPSGVIAQKTYSTVDAASVLITPSATDGMNGIQVRIKK